MATANDTPSLADVENQIASEIEAINQTISQTDLHEQKGAAEKLPKILRFAKSLANEIVDLGNREKGDDLQAARDVEAEYRAERRRTTAERREQISKDGDTDKAITEVQGVLWAVRGLADVLSQDTVRDDEDWVLSIANSIMDQTERVLEFLDRPGGWQGGES